MAAEFATQEPCPLVASPFLCTPSPSANTLLDPAATDVQPAILSPTLPMPLPLANTVDEPLAIGAE